MSCLPLTKYIFQLPYTHIFVQCLNISADVNEKTSSTVIGTTELDESWAVADCGVSSMHMIQKQILVKMNTAWII